MSNNKNNDTSNFMGAMGSIYPLISKCNKNKNLDFKEELLRWTKLENYWYQWFMHDYGFEPYEIGDSKSRLMLHDLISDMINSGFLDEDSDKDYLSYMLNSIEENIEKMPFLNKKRKGTYQNNMTDFKVSMIGHSYEFRERLKVMGVIDEDYLDTHMTIFHETVIELAQDVAFNWSEKTNIKERTLVFVDMLPHCVNIVTQQWITLISEQWTNNSSPPTVSGIWSFLNDFNSVIKDMDMGYNSKGQKNMIWLQEDIGQFLIEFSKQAYHESWSSSIKSKSRWEFLAALEPYLIDAWESAGKKVMSDLHHKWEEMDEDEQKAWLNSKEAKEPMPIEVFYNELRYIIELPINLIRFDINKETLLKRSQKELAILWGASDAISRIREDF